MSTDVSRTLLAELVAVSSDVAATSSRSRKEEAQRLLDEAPAAGHEGVVVILEDAASPYAAGRCGKAWRKVKPVRTYDLVVLGADCGHGRRRGRLSNLIRLGARDPRTDDFLMVSKCFRA